MKKAYIMVVMFATLSLSTFSACGDTSTAPPPTVLNPDEDNSDGSDGGEGDETSEMTRIYDIVKKNQLAYIRSLQISSGAIKDNEQSNSRILNSDIIHLRKPDARDWDGLMQMVKR